MYQSDLKPFDYIILKHLSRRGLVLKSEVIRKLSRLVSAIDTRLDMLAHPALYSDSCYGDTPYIEEEERFIRRNEYCQDITEPTGFIRITEAGIIAQQDYIKSMVDDNFRFWFPVILSIIAIVISIVAIVLSIVL
jgi:hypothetical protein